MSREFQADMADMKDLASQAKLEAKIKGREVKTKLMRKAVQKSGHQLTAKEEIQGAKMVATDTLHTAEDVSKQAALELKKKTRDARVALGKTQAAKALDVAASAASDKIIDAKEAVVDAIAPEVVTVEASSARGVDITHAENALNDRVQQRQATLAARQARDEERIQEAKRQQLVDDATAAAAALKAKVSAAAESVAAVVAPAVKSAEVALGKAVLAAKDTVDDVAAKGEPVAIVHPKTAASGVDISSVSNARNESLSAREHREVLLAKAVEPTLADKTKAAFASAGAAIKDAYVAATSDLPVPHVEHKVSEHGVDISHVANPLNAQLAAREEDRMRREKMAIAERQKAVLKAELRAPSTAPATGHPAPASAAATVEQPLPQPLSHDATLGEKLTAFGTSLSAAVHKFSAELRADVDELLNPLPPPIAHPNTSANGIDTTALAGANNDAIGASIRRDRASVVAGVDVAPTALPKEPLKDRFVKATLDAGVAAREGLHTAQAKTNVAAAKTDVAVKDASTRVSVKAHDASARVSAAAHDAARSANRSALDAQQAMARTAQGAKVAVTQGALDAKVAVTQTAHDAKVAVAQTAQDAKNSVALSMQDAKVAALSAKNSAAQSLESAKIATVQTAQNAKEGVTLVLQDAKAATVQTAQDVKNSVALSLQDAKVATVQTAQDVKNSVALSLQDGKDAAASAKSSLEHYALDAQKGLAQSAHDAKVSLNRTAANVKHETHVALQRLDDKIAPADQVALGNVQ